MTSDAREMSQRCPALKKSGEPCTANAGSDGFCIGHSPGATEARRKGGFATSRAARAGKLLPARLRPRAEILEKSITDVYEGKLEPRAASAIASLSSALVRSAGTVDLETAIILRPKQKAVANDELPSTHDPSRHRETVSTVIETFDVSD